MAEDESQVTESEVIETEEFKAQKAENWKTYLRLAEKNMDKARERKEYAIKQFDTLMIALSTAGLGFTSNYIKDLEENLFWARTAQVLFLACLLSNLFSHVFSMWTHKIGLKLSAKEFELDSYGEDHVQGYDKKVQKSRQFKVTALNHIVRAFNFFAFSALIGAISSFIYYTFIS